MNVPIYMYMYVHYIYICTYRYASISIYHICIYIDIIPRHTYMYNVYMYIHTYIHYMYTMLPLFFDIFPQGCPELLIVLPLHACMY